ncbi:putative GPI transamidase subunit PIG-U [Monocercomonoides exilis]|uniref:putative GPI transamidase subunit PIG-U n=1 Tax=Monocercomonoides exilis TaxID=2049356 RepID=UPI0035597169|nr:putative GPI transamidase subunit PIG-U [Monocercomonoides exilis]|eukprot:MONOS_13049.1-p1 / transcript=MONOS_13049.1 / gene=MONOS_13049 / organism=Monocercomonoides_exilis_PA203 / gene_product=unspecified product / transcript_product=unspecified product / location=Mono_scaffold00772:1362-2710(+) / protein_length=373 / sequence_SO=supercontig / SO=protein_coding / is_pseudo=false
MRADIKIHPLMLLLSSFLPKNPHNCFICGAIFDALTFLMFWKIQKENNKDANGQEYKPDKVNDMIAFIDENKAELSSLFFYLNPFSIISCGSNASFQVKYCLILIFLFEVNKVGQIAPLICASVLLCIDPHCILLLLPVVISASNCSSFHISSKYNMKLILKMLINFSAILLFTSAITVASTIFLLLRTRFECSLETFFPFLYSVLKSSFVSPICGVDDYRPSSSLLWYPRALVSVDEPFLIFCMQFIPFVLALPLCIRYWKFPKELTLLLEMLVVFFSSQSTFSDVVIPLTMYLACPHLMNYSMSSVVVFFPLQCVCALLSFAFRALINHMEMGNLNISWFLLVAFWALTMLSDNTVIRSIRQYTWAVQEKM